MAIRIITDSTSDMPASDAERLGIEVVPLKVSFGSETYTDGIDLTSAQFYQKLAASSALPTTSQITPDEMLGRFSRALEAGDQVIGIFLSSELSGTYQSAALAKNMLQSENIFLIDSQTVTFGLAVLVLEAVRMRQQRFDAGKIAARLETLKHRLRLYAIVDDLKYLRKGGRLSAAGAFAGILLNIKPLIAIEDGKVIPAGKARGMKGAYELLASLVRQAGGIDDTLPFAAGHSNSPEGLQSLLEYLAPSFDLSAAYHAEIGSTVGTHAGPGCVGIAFFTPDSTTL